MDRKTITLIVLWEEIELVSAIFRDKNQSALRHGSEHPWFPGFFVIEMSWHPLDLACWPDKNHKYVKYVVVYAHIKEIEERCKKHAQKTIPEIGR